MIKSGLLTWNTLPTQAFIQCYEHIGIEIFNALHSARYCELSQNGVSCLDYTYNEVFFKSIAIHGRITGDLTNETCSSLI